MELKEIPAVVAGRMMHAVDADTDRFIDTDDFESLFEAEFDKTIELYGVSIHPEKYPVVYDRVLASSDVEGAIDFCKELVNDLRAERIAYYRDEKFGGYMYAQMRQRGLSQGDFV